MTVFYAIPAKKSNRYFVGYKTEGIAMVTVVCECTTMKQAEDEAIRMNKEQLARDIRLQHERDLEELHRINLGTSTKSKVE